MDPITTSFLESIITLINSVIDISYVATIIFATFVFIKIIDELNKEKLIPVYVKVAISALVGSLTGYIWYSKGVEIRVLITSFFFATFSYENLVKFLLDKYNFGYRRTR